MQTYPFILAPKQEIKIPCQEIDFIGCMLATAAFEVMPEGQNPLDMELGISVKLPKPVKYITVINGAVAQTINLVLGTGEIYDNRLVGTLNITGGVNVAGTTSIDNNAVTVNAAATLIIAGATNIASVLIYNNSLVDIYVGSATVSVANGMPVKSGESITITTKASLYGIASSGTANTRYLRELI